MRTEKALRLVFLTVLAFVAATSILEASLGQSINLAWDPNTEPDLSGYKLYYGTSSRNYTENRDVGNVTGFLLPNLLDGQTYFVAVKAYDNFGNESGYSNEISDTPGKPGYFRAWRQAINELWRTAREIVFNS